MYITAIYNVSEAFPTLQKRADGDPYQIEYVPLAWLPMEFDLKFSKFARLQRQGAVDMTEDEIDAVSKLAGEVFNTIVVDWNLTDNDGKVIPIPSEEDDESWRQVPMAILQGLLLVATRDATAEIPLGNGQPSGDKSPTPASLNRQARRASARTSRAG